MILICTVGSCVATALASPVDEVWEAPPPSAGVISRGSAFVEPDLAEVHTKSTMDWVFVVGAGGMGVGDGLRVEDPVFHGMRISKHSLVQLDPSACTPMVSSDPSTALVTASATGDVRLELARSTDSPDIHAFAYTDVWITEGSLDPGEEIRLRFGDTEAGEDCGHQTPDRAFEQIRWRGWEWVDAARLFATMPETPTYDVLPQTTPSALYAVGPSRIGAGEEARVKVAVLDVYGNALDRWEGEVVVQGPDGEGRVSLEPGALAWADLYFQFDEPGIYRLEVEATGGLQGRTNPIQVLEQAPDRRLYWGDIHTHHGHSTELEGGLWHDQNVAYGRDVMGLDVTSESMKGEPLEIEAGAVWAQLRDNCTVYSEPGVHISLLGWEWMGNGHGHHNIYYDGCEGELGGLGLPNLAEEDGLWAWLDDHEERTGLRAVTIPHASLYTGFDWYRARGVAPDQDERYRTTAEVYSAWGSSMDPASEAGSVPNALKEGVRVGFIGASDNHTGWMGNTIWSEKNTPPGLGAFWATELTSEEIFAALSERRTYATTGARILVDYWLEDGEQRIEAGEAYLGPYGRPLLHWQVAGTDTLRQVRLLAVEVGGSGGVVELEVVYPNSLDAEGSLDLRKRDWPGGAMAVWLEAEQEDGEHAWSSPIWLEQECGCGGGSAGWLLLPLFVVAGRRRSS